ncbi:uncharacterized protein LOC125241867 isoform X2 [Leguminivora glycinivorella]|uniref:uncharacterized protein LOC125241867 isoform X2 n=1 Tax=Leguminivora glycinivorella TaxID=1035111 RepID=UPI00200ECDD1|nr:uncharacterized protein LOC125241867 isoform X2 [Leguminivora glycinivorella]
MLALELDALSKFSETSIAAGESEARWCNFSRTRSRERVRNSVSDTSPMRYDRFGDLHFPTNESHSLASGSASRDYFRDNKSSGIQLCTSSVRDEAPRYEVDVKHPIQRGNTKCEGFGNCPPVAPVTVLKRNETGQWTKVEVTAAGEDQMCTPSENLTQATPDASGAAGALDRPRRFVRRLLRELIASLPLLSNNVEGPMMKEPIKKCRHIPSNRSLSSPPACRSLSVQTLTREGF